MIPTPVTPRAPLAGLRRWARLAATAPEGVFPMLIKADQSCLMVIDVQERLGRAGTPECKELLEKIK